MSASLTLLHDLSSRGVGTTTSHHFFSSCTGWESSSGSSSSSQYSSSAAWTAWLRRTYPMISTTKYDEDLHGGSSTSAFVVNVDARRPAYTPFHRRPRLLRGCGADMEQLADISHIVVFAGVIQASIEDGTVCPKLSWSRQLCLQPHLTNTLFTLRRTLSLF